MTRIIRVETCDRCPHAYGSRGCRHPEALVDVRGVQTLRPFDDYFIIPAWCPLEQDGPDWRPPATPNLPANLPGGTGGTVACRSCGTETTSGDGICPACADAMREERAAALEGRCRVHRVRFAEDLPVSVLREMQAEWGRC